MFSWELQLDSPAGNRRKTASRAVIFDLDDTLYPRSQFVQSGFAAVASYVESLYGIPAREAFATMSHANRDGRAGSEFQVLCERHELSRSVVPVLVNVFRMHRPVLRLRAGVTALLADLRRSGWRVAILTNGLPSVQRSKVLALGLTTRVDDVIYAEELRPGGKPDPAVFLETARRIGVPSHRCVFVGDDPVCDIAGARAVRMKTVRLDPGTRNMELGTGEADVVIDSLDDLPPVASALIQMVTVNVA